ncbi:TIR domain-containing protein [Crocosphaera sp. UHCC 0190]|uniref:TIR domain-containing protein n=1 Tax=Crocosphaera sp. UHCC 0190 TaxID=3110246 RepID=UPI002B20605A|nr:TIR domain-containing protein [Crocosphaera sp. UHCC 0190]MEA5510026.1 TIR domain-containing protein [Crocosphaera sp. UHCC 0190]
MKPRVFISSSIESLAVAEAVQKNLEHRVKSTIWTQGLFELSSHTLEDLMVTLEQFDFAIFIFSFHDIALLEEKDYQLVRDQVMFKLGLFLGRLGNQRCFIILPKKVKKFSLPTDFLDVRSITYEPNSQEDNLLRVLDYACYNIQQIISQLGFLPSTLNNQNSQADSFNSFKLNRKEIQILLTIVSQFQGRLYDERKSAFIQVKPPLIPEKIYANLQSEIELDYYLDSLQDKGLLDIINCLTKEGRKYLVENNLIQFILSKKTHGSQSG